MGSYTTTSTSTPYGDFLQTDYSERWYGTDADDPNNKSSIYYYVYNGKEKVRIYSFKITSDARDMPIYLVNGDKEVAIIAIDDNTICCYSGKYGKYFVYNYQTGDLDTKQW